MATLPYTGPISVAPGTTVKAICVAQDGSVSSVMTSAFTGFDPTSVGQPSLWLRADGVVTGGTTWNDLSGHAAHAVCRTGSLVVNQGVRNGLPGVYFSGAAGNTSLLCPNVTVGSVFAVFDNDGDGETPAVWAGTEFSAVISLLNTANIIGTAGNPDFYSGGLTGTDKWVNGVHTFTLDINDVTRIHCVSLTCDPTTDQPVIGFDRNEAGRWWNGRILEIIVYPTILGTTDRQTIENGLMARYKLPHIDERTQWVHDSHTPVLAPTNAWEQTAIQEPRPILLSSGNWVMSYTGGFDTERIGWATSSDGITWTKNANPIIGGGHGNEAGTARGSCLVWLGGNIFEVFYGTDFQSALYRQVSTDGGATWGSKTTVLAIGSMPSGFSGYGNVFMALDVDGVTWRITISLFKTSNGVWMPFTCTSTDRVTWTMLTPMVGIDINLAMADGGWFTKIGATYHLYYHSGNSNFQDLPTDIYHAVSEDFVHWKRVVGPALGRADEINTAAITGPSGVVDQVADVRLVYFAGTWYAFYSRVNNVDGKANIALATYAGTLDALI